SPALREDQFRRAILDSIVKSNDETSSLPRPLVALACLELSRLISAEDEPRAALLLRRSASLGSPEAMEELGRHLAAGELGMRASRREALEVLRRGFCLGHGGCSLALANLVDEHERGKFVERALELGEEDAILEKTDLSMLTGIDVQLEDL